MKNLKNFGKCEKYCKISKILIFFKFWIFFQKFWIFFWNFEKIWKVWNFLKFLTIFFKILNGLPGWFNWPAWLADPVFWGPGVCCSWPTFPDRLHWALTLKPSDTYTSGPKSRSQPLHQPFVDFERLERGGMGQRGKSLLWRVEFSGSLTHLLGTS